MRLGWFLEISMSASGALSIFLPDEGRKDRC
jgi:hypothetical protein